MILPAAIDHQVIPGIALPLKAKALEQGGAAQIGWHIACHDAVQAVFPKQIRYSGTDHLLHQTLTLMGFIDGITEVTGLEHAHHDVGEVAGGDHLLALGVERHQMDGAAVEELAIAVAQSTMPVTQGIEALVTAGFPGGEVSAVAQIEIQHQVGPFGRQDCDSGAGRAEVW